MAVERASVDGYGGSSTAVNSTSAIAPYPREQHTSDGASGQSNGPHHERHHASGNQHHQQQQQQAPPPPHQQQQQQQPQQPQHHHHHHHQDARQTLPDVDREAFMILREQVSYNYQCIQADRDAIARFDAHLGQFQSTVMRMLDDFRHEIGSKGSLPSDQASTSQQSRFDHGDIDVLATQIATVSTKVNEIDSLKVQLELMKSKVRRLEQENQALQVPRPNSAASHRDSSTGHESQHYPTSHPPQPSLQHQQQQSQHYPPQHHGGAHQHLPPIQTGASTSPRGRDQHSSYHPQTAPRDSSASYPHHQEQRPSSGELHAPPHMPPVQRPPESAPQPPGTVSGWRPVLGTTPLTPHPSTGSVRSTPQESDPHSAAWAAANANHIKRPYEDGPLREQSVPGSPKRPKLAPLAPLAPRNSVGEDVPPSYPHQHSGQEQYQINGRLPVHERHPPPPQLLTTPASATAPTAPNSYRFIATTPHEASEQWRDGDSRLTPTSARGRGRGRGRASRSRGGRADGIEREQDHGEWQQKALTDWHAHGAPAQQQLSPNGYYAAHRPLPPRGAGENAHHEYPLTPIASAVSPGDHGLLTIDGSTGNKKTRTKPIRNANGVLIRKDGRPDMRSVSSANNLRKVHAKKEAERAETHSRTPTSARELAPAGQGFTGSDEDGDDMQMADHGDGTSRSVTPRTQADSERNSHEVEQRERSASSREEKDTNGEHPPNSKSERDDEGEEDKHRIKLAHRVDGDKLLDGQRSPASPTRARDRHDDDGDGDRKRNEDNA